jgi:hypothetical protein
LSRATGAVSEGRTGKKAPAAAPPPFHALLINGSELSAIAGGGADPPAYGFKIMEPL